MQESIQEENKLLNQYVILQQNDQQLNEKQDSSEVVKNSIRSTKLLVFLLFLGILLIVSTLAVYFLFPLEIFSLLKEKGGSSETNNIAQNFPDIYIKSSSVNLKYIPNPNLKGIPSGFANRNVSVYSIIYSIIASLPYPDESYLYKAWIVNTDDPTDYIFLGRLNIGEKGQHLLLFQEIYYPEYVPYKKYSEMKNKIVVSLEHREEPNLTNAILEGIFSE